MTTAESKVRLYGVSTGDGNNGVSHMFADYYVITGDPWRLALAATLAEFKSGFGKAWALRNVDIDGDSEYGISACLYNPPCEDSEDGEYPDHCPAYDALGLMEYNGHDCDESPDDCEDGRNYSDGNGAWFLLDVFPAEDLDTRNRPVYDSIEDALDKESFDMSAENYKASD